MPLLLDTYEPENHKPSVADGETPPQRYSFLGLRALKYTAGAVVGTTYFQGLWSPQYNDTGLNVDFVWTATGTGVAVWGISLARYQYGVTALDGDPGTVFGTEQVVVTASIGSAYLPMKTSLTVLDAVVTPLALEFYRARIRHLGTHGSRTIAVSPLLLAVGVSNFDD